MWHGLTGLVSTYAGQWADQQTPDRDTDQSCQCADQNQLCRSGAVPLFRFGDEQNGDRGWGGRLQNQRLTCIARQWKDQADQQHQGRKHDKLADQWCTQIDVWSSTELNRARYWRIIYGISRDFEAIKTPVNARPMSLQSVVLLAFTSSSSLSSKADLFK